MVRQTMKPKRKITYWLSALLTPVVVFLVTTFDSLAEAVRLDEFSMGPWYYLILIAAGLISNAGIVLLTQQAEANNRIRIWMKANLITAAAILLMVILFAIVFGISMSTSHWNFG